MKPGYGNWDLSVEGGFKAGYEGSSRARDQPLAPLYELKRKQHGCGTMRVPLRGDSRGEMLVGISCRGCQLLFNEMF